MYPNDIPAINLSDIWNSGSYTPEDMVVYIRDNYTPVNKTSMRNSLGYQISAVQNYVNSRYLGRESVPVATGYINTLHSSGIYDSKEFKITNSDGEYIYVTPTSLSIASTGSPSLSMGIQSINITDNGIAGEIKSTSLQEDRLSVTTTTMMSNIAREALIKDSGVYFTYTDASANDYKGNITCDLSGNLIVGTSGLLPAGSGICDLGSQGRPYGNIYANSINVKTQGVMHLYGNYPVSSGASTVGLQYDPFTTQNYNVVLNNILCEGRLISLDGTLEGMKDGNYYYEPISGYGISASPSYPPSSSITFHLKWDTVNVALSGYQIKWTAHYRT